MKTSGTARLISFDEYISWYSQLSLEEAESVKEKLSDLTKDLKKANRDAIEEYVYRKAHVFVSVKKTDCWRWDGYRSEARANFELYREEYINLTYLNSVWLEWVITNKKLGGWTVGGKTVDYAYAIRYLKTAMDHIRKREAEEQRLIDAVDPKICKDAEWPVKLSEWKLANHVRYITEYQAKRFVRDMTA